MKYIFFNIIIYLITMENRNAYLFAELDQIKKRIENGEDIIGRDDSFKKVDINHKFPKYILQNNIQKKILKSYLKLDVV